MLLALAQSGNQQREHAADGRVEGQRKTGIVGTVGVNSDAVETWREAAL